MLGNPANWTITVITTITTPLPIAAYSTMNITYLKLS